MPFLTLIRVLERRILIVHLIPLFISSLLVYLKASSHILSFHYYIIPNASFSSYCYSITYYPSSPYNPLSLIQAATPSVHISPTFSHSSSFAAFLIFVELIPEAFATPFPSRMSICFDQWGLKPKVCREPRDREVM